MSAVTGSSHCGAVSYTLAGAPTAVTECNCSLCRKYGVIWAYLDAEALTLTPDPPVTDTYAWNGKRVDFHRCATCGRVTPLFPRKEGRANRGVNARPLDPDVLAVARLRHKDGANTDEYLD